MKKLNKRYPEKRILITGATSGLGEAMAILFAEQGWKVAVTGRNMGKVKLSADKVRAAGGDVLELEIEVTTWEHFEAAAKAVEKEWGGLDILINNAGVATGAPVEKTSLEEWRKTLDINLNSVFYGSKAFIPIFQRQKHGHVVVIASSAGIACAPEMASYSVSKAGAISLAETMAGELAKYDVDVTVSCAAAFKSGLLEQKESNSSQSVSIEGVRRDMEKTSVTSKDIALYTIRSMSKKHLYSFPDPELRQVWRLKRIMPQTLYRVVGLAYKHNKWKFKNKPAS